jgi:hypothetical protein
MMAAFMSVVYTTAASTSRPSDPMAAVTRAVLRSRAALACRGRGAPVAPDAVARLAGQRAMTDLIVVLMPVVWALLLEHDIPRAAGGGV